MNKQEWAALVNTLRIALVDAQRERELAQEGERRAEMRRAEAIRQIRELEQRAGAPNPITPAPAIDYARAIKLINSGNMYRPAMGEEAPDLWVQNAHMAEAERVPFVQIR